MINRHLVKRIIAIGLSITLNMHILGTGNAGQEVQASEQNVVVVPEKSYGYFDSGYRAGSVKQTGSKEQILMAKPIPQKYSSVEKGYVTPVKDQNPLGTCWAFGAIAAMESYALTHGLVDDPSDIDLSEYALAYLAFDDSSFVDDIGTTAGDVTTTTNGMLNAFNKGGNNSYVFKALSKWAGIYNEADFKYDYTGQMIVEYDPNKVSYILTGQKYISMSDVEHVKQAIMENGAVATSYFSDDKYSVNGEAIIDGYKVTLLGYYNYAYESVGTNHAIAIVGWDDTIAKENFTVNGHTPEGDGGWLIKNSWGTYFGDAGYMWISYYDLTIKYGDAVVYEIAPRSEYTYNYQHDGSSAFGYGTSFTAKTFANVFEVKGSASQEISAVSFAISNTNRAYSIQIYLNPEVDKPTSGIAMLSAPVTGKTTYEGYYTVNLPEKISVSRGDTFSVVITFDENTRIVTSSGKNRYIGGGGSAIMNSVVSDNQSYLGSGNTFLDMYDSYNSYYINFCIKAFANDADDSISASAITSIQSDGSTGLLINWQKVKDGITYKLLRSTSINGTYTTVYSGNGTSFKDTNVSLDADYYYKVRVYDGDTPLDSAVKLGRLEVTPTILKNVELTAEGIEIIWDTISIASGYKLYRSEDGVTYKEIANLTTNYFLDTDIKFGKIYSYYVKVYVQSDTLRESDSSNVILFENSVPMPDFSMVDTSEKGKVTLMWEEKPWLDGYILYRSYWDENNEYVEMEELVRLPVGSYEYTDDISDLVPGRNVTYYIKGYVVQNGQTLIGDYNYTDVYMPYPEVENIKWYVQNSALYVKWDAYSAPGMTITGYELRLYPEMYTDTLEILKTPTSAYAAMTTVDYTKYYYATVRAKNAMNNIFTDEQYPRIQIGGVLTDFAVDNIADRKCDLNDTVTLTAYMQDELENFDYQYQWYETTSKTATTGTLIPGATSKTYTFTMNSASDKFYYCFVTGMYNESKSATSNVVKVSITSEIKDISGATISAIPNQTYIGSAITPEITVTLDGKTLVKGTDYTITYSNNTNVGTATVTITGKGNYTGTKSITFVISAKSISGATVSSISNQTYTGSAITPSLTVTLNGKTLVKGTDYTIAYSNNTNVGTATVTITGKGNYTGTKSITFAISAKSISGATVSSISNQTYTGSAITPSLTVTLNGKTLVKGTDYTIAYSNNTNVGTATVTITGRGNYTGTKSTTFVISAKSISGAIISDISNKVYTGSAITPSLTVTLDGKTLEKDRDYTVSYSDNTEVGTAKVTVTGIGNYTGTKNSSFAIVKFGFNDLPVPDIADKTYTGNPIEPRFTIKINGVELVENTDYKIIYENNVNVGIATVKLAGIGSYGGELVATFNIVAKSVNDLTIDNIPNQTYNGNSILPLLTIYDGSKKLTLGTDYSLMYYNYINAGTCTVKVTGKGNYTGVREYSFVINPRAITEATLSAVADQKHTGSAITPNVVIKYNNTTLVKGVDYTLSYSNNVNEGTATITITGKGNFSGSRTTTFKIIQDIPLSITSSKISINQSSYIVSKITVGTTVSQLLSSIDQSEYVSVYNDGIAQGANTVLATGMQLSIVKDGKAYKNYTIVVTGDTNGDGKVNITDMIAVKAHILKKNTLSNVYFSGGDTNGDGKVNITDFIKIKGYILKKNSIEGVSIQ